MTGASHGPGGGLPFGEHVILVVRRHWVVPAAEIVLSAPLMVVALSVCLLAAVRIDPKAGSVAIGSGFAVAGVWIGVPLLRWSATSLTLTNRRVVVATGVLRRRRTAIAFEAIKVIGTEPRTIAGRILGYGTITIGTATDAVDVAFRHVRLDELRDRLLANVAAHNMRRGPLERSRVT